EATKHEHNASPVGSAQANAREVFSVEPEDFPAAKHMCESSVDRESKFPISSRQHYCKGFERKIVRKQHKVPQTLSPRYGEQYRLIAGKAIQIAACQCCNTLPSISELDQCRAQITPCELIAHRSRIRCARNDSDVLPDHVVESKKLLAGLNQYTGAVCEHHARKVHNLHARQRNGSRSALHVGGVVNNRIEPSALVSRHPFYPECHVQLRFKRSCNAFAKFDCVTDWPSLSV